MFFSFILVSTSFRVINSLKSFSAHKYLTHTVYKFKSHLVMATSASILNGTTDPYGGVTIDSEHEKCSTEEFVIKLEDSLKLWEETKKRGIWFKVYIEQADWVPILTKKGFNFHHARKDFVMMYRWLPKESKCNIPSFANTMIGVGAVVVNDKNEILVVSEKHIPRPHWKLPGGYVEEGENLVDAAIREVMEETNIRTEFTSLLTLRHVHNRLFGCSDIYFVVALKPLNEDITKCDEEIGQSKWMNIDEYMEHPHVHELNRLFVQKYLEYKKRDLTIDCIHGIHPYIKVPYTVYYISDSNK